MDLNAKREIHGKKQMLCVYWCSTNVLFWEILPPDQNFNSNVYISHMQAVEQKIWELLYKNQWNGPVFILEDNAKSHTSEKSVNFKEKTLH